MDRTSQANRRFCVPVANQGMKASRSSRQTQKFDILLSPGIDLLVLDGAPLELAGRVALYGRLVFEADPRTRVVWEATTRKIYLDELPRITKAHQEFADAVRRGR